MNYLLRSLITVSLLTAGSTAMAQSLLSIRPGRDEFEKRLPFTLSLSAGVGYDSNVNLSHDDEHESAYSYAGIELQYAGGDRRTHYTAGASYTGFYYWDAPETQDDYMQNARAWFTIMHRASPQLTISDNFYAAYEFKPNYSIGVGANGRTDQYFYLSNDLAVSYAWSRKFSTVTGYAISGILYDDDSLSGEDYLTHLFHQEFRYTLTRRTTLAFDYRFAITEYDSGFGDYTSHFFLVGLDHSFSRRSFGSFRAGAEVRDRDFGGSDTAPYVEAVFTHQTTKDTSLNWYARAGFENSDIGDYQERYGFRTGVTATHRFTPRLTGNAGIHYIHDIFEDSPSAEDSEEDIISIGVGLDYLLYRNIFLNTHYSFSTSNSDNEFRDYDRHEVAVGIRAVF